jgi:iron complex transport system ATP-binding protein
LESAVISINKITLEIDGREIIAGFSQEIPSGAITAIVGPNGSGKSTLLAAISGLITPTSGTITINGVQAALTSPSELAKVRAMVIQSQFYSLGFTVRQVLEMAGPADGIMKELELTNIADRLVTTLSGGESQRVAIAQAVAQNTPILLLDEPLAAQDIESRERIIQILTKLADSGKTVVVVVHENEKDLTWASGNLIQIQSII